MVRIRFALIGMLLGVLFWAIPSNGQEIAAFEDAAVVAAVAIDDAEAATAGLFRTTEDEAATGLFVQQATPASSPASTYAAGDGLTVSMLNGKSQLKLFGQLSAMSMFSTSRPFAPGMPLFLLPDSPFGLNTNTFDLHARQSAFGAIFAGPEVMGLTPSATVLVFLANDTLTGDSYGLLPYQAYGELKNDEWRFAAGLQSDVFNPVSPSVISLAKLFTSGNTGSFRGQMRLERTLNTSDDFSIKSQIALSEPIQSVFSNRDLRILEDNGWPNVEGRAAVGFGEITALSGGRKQRPVELGVSGVVGQLRTSRSILAPPDPQSPVRKVVNTWGFGADLQVAATEAVGFAGEFFTGQGLGEYNGGISQSFNSVTLRPIRSTGGFGEAYCYLTEKFHVHTGYGIDAPDKNDLASTQIMKNQTYFTNFVWNLSQTVQISFEVDYRKTEYSAPLLSADGMLFQTEFLWKF